MYFLLFILHTCAAHDFIRESFRYINQSSDPCDDFFRHACPFGNYGKLSANFMHKVETNFFKNRKARAWDNLGVLEAKDKVKLAEVPENTVDYITSYFQSHCERSANTSSLLSKIESITHKTKSPRCQFTDCLAPLSYDRNCNRSANFLKQRISSSINAQWNTTKALIKHLENEFGRNILVVNGVALLLAHDLRKGVEFVNSIIKDMLEILKEWIESTPWVEYHSLKAFTNSLASEIQMADNFGSVLEETLDRLMQIETTFLSCITDIGEDGELICLYYTAAVLSLRTPYSVFFNNMNAFNNHPTLAFGFPLLYVAKNSVLSAKLGFVGFVAGHEIAHTLIENPKNNELMPAYSVQAIECVQNQYNNTCEEYREVSCGVRDNQIDENGADILGAQLAYKLLEKYYEDAMEDEYLKLNHITINHQQLFFYSAAFTFCNSFPVAANEYNSHSAANVRINALAQLPGFQKAFHCSPESRMMKTVEKQCIIFGEHAPAQRK